MKASSIFLCCLFFVNTGFTQLINIKAGMWSDKSVWSNQNIPTSIDDVELNFNITIDINAGCQSLTLNGHTVTVNSGVTFNISGSANATTLSMYIDIDSTASNPSDTIAKSLFQYDSLKRNTVIDLLYYNNGVATSQQYKSTFFYYDRDTLPFKKIVKSPFLPNTDEGFYEVEAFYFYTNGKITKDSSIQFSAQGYSTFVNNYIYNNGGFVQFSIGYDGNKIQLYTTSDTFYLQRINGNVTSQVHIDSTFNFVPFVDIKKSQLAYDNHPNPFYSTQNGISLDYKYPIYIIEATNEQIFERNNVIEIDQSDGSDYNYHYKYIYEYKANGYPKKVRYYNQNVPGHSGKGLYFYSN